ncbi:MAG TPA: response regulator [Phycisphaerales bacterium]|nr:response regulator [Phycisphaerales bacterium]
MFPLNLSILLVEDNPADARLIEITFAGRHDGQVTVEKAETLAAAISKLDRTPPVDLVLLDLTLPDSEGLDTLKAIEGKAPEIPVVVLSGHTDEELALSAVREGAQDYLVKGRIDAEMLNRSVRYAIERKRVQRESERATRALAESEERLRLVTEASTDGIWDWNMVTNEVIWSDRMYELLRVQRAGEIRANIEELMRVHPDDRDLVRTALREHLEESKAYILEVRLLRGDNSYGYFHISGKVVRDGEGKPVRMAGSISDITERRKAEIALRASEQRFQSFMDNSPVVAFMKDEWGRYVYVNAVFQKHFGHAQTHITGRPDTEVWPTDVAERLRSTDLKVLETNAPIEVNELVPQQDGIHEWLTVKFPIVEAGGGGGGGGRRYICGVGVDITERRRAEQALREADEKLRQSQKMEAVGQLASGIAHDFNNLLTAIRGYASLARNTLSTNHPALESLDQVEEASRQATGVAGALLTFARKAHTEKEPVKLCEAVESAARLFRRTLPPTVRLILDLNDADDLWVSADSTQLQQVVINLGLNARDAIGEQDGTLTVAVVPARKDGTPIRRKTRNGHLPEKPEAVNLVVRDTGSGMSPDVKARIFEPFFTTKPRGRGTGLGLAVIHGIVQEHNGTITVDSAPAKGSTFTVTLPLTAAPVREEPQDEQTPELLGGGLALLAEDNQLVRGLLASMLSTLGYEIAHASSAEQALKIAASMHLGIDLLVADELLPGKSGIQLLEELRSRGQAMSAIIVAASPDSPRPELSPGVVMLNKPFQLADIRNALAELYKASKAGNAV